MHCQIAWTWITALVVGAGPLESGPHTSLEPTAVKPGVIEHCQVFLIDDVQVPARESGALISLSVREGDRVQAGQPVAHIDDRQARYDQLAAELKRDVALAKADDDIEVRFARASLAVAEAELSQNQEINRRSPGSVSTAELRRLKLTRERAELQIIRNELEQKVAGMTADIERTAVAAATDDIQRRQIVAPFDGVVLELFKQSAEWVNAGEPVLRIIRLDRLRVEGFLHVQQLNPEEVLDRAVTVEIRRAHGQTLQLGGRVVYVSPLVQGGYKYRVRAEVQNRAQNGHWLAGPGMMATIHIHVEKPTARLHPDLPK
jgi:macrolide-specific efflux system membrane fusion protein